MKTFLLVLGLIVFSGCGGKANVGSVEIPVNESPAVGPGNKVRVFSWDDYAGPGAGARKRHEWRLKAVDDAAEFANSVDCVSFHATRDGAIVVCRADTEK